MVILLVILTFAVFVAIDLIREHRRSLALLREGEALHAALAGATATTVAGFHMPQWLRYSQGHMWVHQVGPDLAYVGIDDFARRLAGRDAHFSLPSVGTCIGGGQPAVGLRSHGHHVQMVSPVGGEIVGVNPRLRKEPHLPHRDCYGRGWLFKVRSPHLFKEVSTLFSGSLVRRWMEDTRERFQYRIMLATGSVLQDGGVPVEDVSGALSAADWQSLVDQFLALEEPGD